MTDTEEGTLQEQCPCRANKQLEHCDRRVLEGRGHRCLVVEAGRKSD